MNVLPPIIFISLENWDHIWRRNQFVCSELSRRWPGTRILFVGLPLDVSNAVRTLKFGRLGRSGIEAIAGLENIVATYPLKVLPNTLGVGRAFNDFLFRMHIKRAAARLGMVKPLLWINSHAAEHVVGHLDECAAIYDVTDDWTTLKQPEMARRRTIEQDERLCRHADAVIVCSQRLLDMKRSLAKSIHLIPNGVDVAHYKGVNNPNGPLPAEAGGWPKPVFGYTGTAHPDRVDVPMIAAIALKLGRGSLVFVGPNHLPAQVVEPLKKLGNVHFTGPVPYQRIPEYMRAFDVCMVPHLVTPFTESLNPIKLWEYLAAGKPIVSTPVAGFRDYPHFVSLAATTDQFFAAMQASLTEDPGLAPARRAEAAKHSWTSRVDQIEMVLNEAIQTKQQSRAAVGIATR